MTEGTQLIRGLEGVVAAETKLCDLDGTNGRLAYGGYDIADLARQATFEEVCYLLWRGELPTRGQYDGLVVSLVAAREIPRELIQAFRLMPKDTDPNRPLQAAIAILGMHDPDADDNSPAANHRKAVRLTAQLATAVAAHHRVRSGQEPVDPAPDLSHAANFLYMLTGTRAQRGGREGLRREPHALRRARAERVHLHDARDHVDQLRHALGGGGRTRRAEGARCTAAPARP